MAIVTGLSSVLTYQVVQESREQQLKVFEAQPAIKRTLDHFRANAPKIDTVDQLLKDRRSLEAVLSAYQLEDQINNTGLLRKILEEDPGEGRSLVNKLVDPRYAELAVSLRGLALGNKPLANPVKVEQIAQLFTENEFEKFAGEGAPGIREALYFKRNADKITDINTLMSNRVLKEVARVATGIPKEVGLLEFEQEKARYEAAVDVEKLKNPKFLDNFIKRFLIQTDIQQSQADPIVSLFDTSARSRPFNIPGTVNLLV